MIYPFSQKKLNSSLLREDSSIMFEVVDEKGNIVWSELSDYNDINGI